MARCGVRFDTIAIGQTVVDQTVTIVIQTIAFFLGGVIDDVLESVCKGGSAVGCVELEASAGLASLDGCAPFLSELRHARFPVSTKAISKADRVRFDLLDHIVGIFQVIDLIDESRRLGAATTFVGFAVGDEQDGIFAVFDGVGGQERTKVALGEVECGGVIGAASGGITIKRSIDGARIGDDAVGKLGGTVEQTETKTHTSIGIGKRCATTVICNDPFKGVDGDSPPRIAAGVVTEDVVITTRARRRIGDGLGALIDVAARLL